MFLLGSAFALLLHQRGLLALHGNSVVIDGHAYVFVGPSGSGKSTLAAWFHDRGYQLIADDVSVVAFSSTGEAEVRPGLPRFRLWHDAIASSGREIKGLQHSYEEDDPLGKYDVPASLLARDTTPLGGVLLLERGDKTFINPLKGLEAIEVLFANLYRGEYLLGDQHRAQWLTCVQLARSYSIGRWQRRWSVSDYDDDVGTLINDLRSASRIPV